jgi:hypothetical protein
MLSGPELGAAIEAARQKKKVTKKAMAAHFGVQPPSIQDWVRHGTIHKSRLEALWSYFADVVGPEHWGLNSAAYHPTEGVSVYPVAQEISYPYLIVAPTLSWEQLMSQPQELPPEFHLVLKDDAMAPRAGAGVKIKLRTGNAAQPGDAVLVRGVDGQLYFREYRALLGNAWEAHATNPAYPSLRSDAHHLEVMAVFIGIDTPWAALSR